MLYTFYYTEILFRWPFSKLEEKMSINQLLWESSFRMKRAAKGTTAGFECVLAWICNLVQVASKCISSAGNQFPMKIFWTEMQVNLIGKALNFGVNLLENAKLNGKLLCFTLEIVSHFNKWPWGNRSPLKS